MERCTKCNRTFEKKQGLHMHDLRAHGILRGDPHNPTHPGSAKKHKKLSKKSLHIEPIRFCPNCGVDIQKISSVISLMKKGAI